MKFHIVTERLFCYTFYMPRSKSHSKEALVSDAMHIFWTHGFAATSMDDLVRKTGVSRHGIYSDVGGKHDLYLAGFTAYQDEVVSPAFAQVEAEGAGLNEIAAYFESQIALAEAGGLPGPGCLAANAMTETAPHNDKVESEVKAHNRRLKEGFSNALSSVFKFEEVDDLAEFLLINAQGLWSLSRVVSDAAILRRHVATTMSLLKAKAKQ